jgi:hypothetical protein
MAWPWLDAAPRWVTLVEKAYVDAARSGAPDLLPRSIAASDVPLLGLAALGAVASRFLAVSSPRSIGLVGESVPIALSLAAHRVWFKPIDVRCHGGNVDGGRAVSVDDALAADIVCIHAPIAIAAAQLRRGTHVNALALVTIDPELHASIFHERADLPALAAGLRDGRQLDEITVMIADGGETATRALMAFHPDTPQ